MGRKKQNMEDDTEQVIQEVPPKKEEKLNESQICNVFKITGTLRDVILKKFEGESLTVDNWRKELIKQRINF